MNQIVALKSAIEKFSDFLEGNCVLNDLVVNKGFVKLPEDIGQKEQCSELMNQVLEYAKQVRIAYGDRPEEYLPELSSLQDDTNEIFFDWLFDYMESVYRAYQDGAPFRDMEPEVFGEMVGYCFDNYIFQVTDFDEAAGQWRDRREEILKLRKIISYYIRLLVWDGRSKKSADGRMANKFGFDQRHCGMIYQYIIGNEDRLWKRLLARRINYLEGCLDDLSNRIGLSGGVG